MSITRKVRDYSLRTSCVAGLLLAAFCASAQISQPPGVFVAWPPVTDAEKQLKAPVVEKNAGVEALYWNVWVRDEAQGQDWQRVLYHHVRLKVFDEKGKEAASTIDIPFGNSSSIMYVAGRTIKPDGTVVELTKDAVHERDVVRAGRTRTKVKSFAMPAVEPGSIVEYRWKEVRTNTNLFYIRLQFQREYPVQKVTYYLKPLSREYTSYQMAIWTVNCKPSPLQQDRDGFSSTTLENVPAFREEPMMPGEANVRPWVLAFYREGGNREPEKYWNQVGKRSYGELKQSLKVNDEIKTATAAAIEGATTDDEKVRGLIRYIRKRMRGLYGPDVTEAERTKLIAQMPKDRNRTSAEVFKSGVGTANELNVLFAAMASQAGLEARPAMVSNRSDILFDPRMADDYFLSSVDMAVKIGGARKLYDVSARLLPPDMILWREQGTPALLSDPKNPQFIDSPLSPPESSLRKRTAHLALSEEGDIEGDIEESYTGHLAWDRRSDFDGQSEARQQEIVKEDTARNLPGAEVSKIGVENVGDAEQPLKIHYHVKVQGYAQRTARRILLQPLYFQRGVAPIFSSSDRKYNMDFPYAWKESDEVHMQLPAGYEFDKPVSTPLEFGPPGSYMLRIGLDDKKELLCARELIFGREGKLHYLQPGYAQVKGLFDEIHSRDNQSIALTQAAAGGK